jgi:predicted ester cyclase
MSATNKKIIINFIDTIWNQQNFDKIDDFISKNFKDYSLPPNLPEDKNGMKQWILATSQSFEHQTNVEEIICEDEKVMLKIRMNLKHIGVWRNIEPTNYEISVVGYRYYKLIDGKIIEHSGMIDGNAIENQLRETSKGCKIQK